MADELRVEDIENLTRYRVNELDDMLEVVPRMSRKDSDLVTIASIKGLLPPVITFSAQSVCGGSPAPGTTVTYGPNEPQEVLILDLPLPEPPDV